MNFLKRKLFIIIVVAALLYLVLSIYADFDKLLISFSNFNFFLLPLILFLSLLNYLFRFYKWNYYLALINVNLNKKDSILIFLSGFLMSITPGKFGEIFKSYLIKKINGDSISKTAPVVLAERITDFLSLAILALIGSYFFDYGFLISLLMTLILIAAILLITNKTFFNLFLKVISRFSVVKEKTPKLQQLFESSESLLKIKPLLFALIISIISWGFECFGYYLIIRNFSAEVTLFWSVFSYSFSTIVGAVSMLPGGLGITEGSFLFMLGNIGLQFNDSTAITFITRSSTLWFAVIIGIISFIIFTIKFGEVKINDKLSENDPIK